MAQIRWADIAGPQTGAQHHRAAAQSDSTQHSWSSPSTRAWGAPEVAVPHDSQALKGRANYDRGRAVDSAIRNKDRADQSFDLVHLTKSKAPCCPFEARAGVKEDGSPLVSHLRFAKMLENREVVDCALPHVSTQQCPVRAVCFSEATSLDMHAKRYSPWGIALSKSFLFNACRANPVLYCRKNLLDEIKSRFVGQADMLRYVTPLLPFYADDQVGDGIDYTHEREWRTPGPVKFEWENLSCVFVPSVKLFKKLLPELYQKVTDACIEIRQLTPTRESDSCAFGYECTNSNCEHKHTEDVELYKDWEKSQRRCKWGACCRREDCMFAHACDGPTCPLDDNCQDANCPYVHTRDAV